MIIPCMNIDTVTYMSRVGDGTVPLAIVIYIDGSFINFEKQDCSETNLHHRAQSKLCSVR